MKGKIFYNGSVKYQIETDETYWIDYSALRGCTTIEVCFLANNKRNIEITKGSHGIHINYADGKYIFIKNDCVESFISFPDPSKVNATGLSINLIMKNSELLLLYNVAVPTVRELYNEHLIFFKEYLGLVY